MMRYLALVLARHAARVLHPVRAVQAKAMLAELEYVEGRDSLAWALGCVMASYRQRASALAIAIAAAQVCVGLAAGAFGFLHVYVGFDNLRAKVLFLAGQLPNPPPEHWLRLFLMFAVCGMLHVAAALMMAVGSSRRVLQLAIVIVGFYLVAPLTGAGQLSVPLIFQAIYIGLITLMAAAAAGLAWLWRWDERRLSARASATGL